MSDPKARKVIVVENAFLSIRVKEMIARVLFDNLQVGLSFFLSGTRRLMRRRQVPSVSFASAHLLALMASGRVTGLVVDVGHLETTVLPVRPLLILTTSLPESECDRSTHHALFSRWYSQLLAPVLGLPQDFVPSFCSTRSTSLHHLVLTPLLRLQALEYHLSYSRKK